MREFFLPVLGYSVIYLTYLAGKFVVAIFLGLHQKHVFLGFGKHPWFTVGGKRLKVSVGLFIPLPFLARFYAVTDGKKERIRYEWEYYDQPVYKRILVTYSGAFMMLLMAIVTFSVIEYRTVDSYISREEANRFGIYPTAELQEWGFEKGDKIITINGQLYERFTQLAVPLYEPDNTTYAVVRGEDTLSIRFDSAAKGRLGQPVFHVNAPFRVTRVVEHSHAEHADLQTGDEITLINGHGVTSIEEIGEVLKSHASDSVNLLVKRGRDTVPLVAFVSEAGKLGFYGESLANYTIRDKTIPESILAGFKTSFRVVSYNMRAIFSLTTGEVQRTAPSGPIGIAQLFGENSLERFFRVTALLMCAGVYYELLPFPRSAGIRMIPIFKEMIFRKRLSFASFRILHQVVWGLIILSMAWNIFLDVYKLF